MIESGMTAMMKALGLDPVELKAHVEAFTSHMKEQAAAINANQRRIEAKLDVIDEKLAALVPRETTTEILDNAGVGTNVLITSERFPQAMIDDVNRSVNEA
jgi:hypothetical protein